MLITKPVSRDLSYFHSLLKSCIHGHISSSSSSSPITIFRDLLRSSLIPNHLTMSIFLQSSTASLSPHHHHTSLDSFKLQVGQIQTHLTKSGLDRFVYVKTSLLNLHLKMGCVTSARALFDEMPERDTVVWNALICGYSRNGYESDAWKLFTVMLQRGFSPSATTLGNLLPFCGTCGFFSQGRSVHGVAAKSGLELHSQVKNALISFYSKCSELDSAEVLFREMKDKNTVSWNTMIGAYSQSGLQEGAITVFKNMFEKNVEISPVTIISLVSAHVSQEPLHCLVVKCGMVNDNSVNTSLVCAYSRCGDSDSAERLYASSDQDSIVGLTSIVSSYAEKGDMDIAVVYFSKMCQLCMNIDAVALVGILHGCTNSSHIDIGMSLHAYAIKSGLCTKTLVLNGLITMYSKFDDVETVLFLFQQLQETPLISWNSVISGCVQSGRASTAFEVFHQMKLSGRALPDAITIASLLAGCSQICCLHLGKELHGYTLRNNFEDENFVCTALIDMYSKCGNQVLAETVFNSIKAPCAATWNSMISGYSLSGLQHRALSCYLEMREKGLKPDKITFLGVLSACTHGGFVDEGKICFREMVKEFGISPSLQHYALIVGLLCRACLFTEALYLIWEMEIKPDSAVWGAMLSACIIHRELEVGEYVAKKMFMLDYRNGGLYVLMSNLYATEEMWEDVVRVRKMMKDNGYDGYLGVSQTI
ncbi:PREDICTED: pentatricopeptide repeat-containing protein At2g04860 [Camelina sativa]|uniref:Pentatricopeptide repeat-containing protein At2g04860 n=1 Tax=Camelina sativa TaxID=90675 RepID=A0ABM0W825_CAMSA|nr:PREDICTED: pentatricopeptide repeat-containing protein At2g04860 [Camelina sativa]XP_010467039.1 PREDICTED: pentatricopeptide repeat-containing protein At2g04860 [Camelina sativa]